MSKTNDDSLSALFGSATSALENFVPPAILSRALYEAPAINHLAAPAAATSPTMSQFLNAANAEYSSPHAPAPNGLSKFMVNGKQLSITDELTGLSASVWTTAQNQVIVAYQGTTGGNNLFTNPLLTLPQVISDIGALALSTAPAEKSAVTFYQTALKAAEAQGYSASNVFVTGHSLGGDEAEYVAQQTGAAGVAFEATGLPKSATAPGNGANFVDIVQKGDPWANYASDVQAEQPLSPAYVPGQGGALPHYGQVVQIGSDQAAATLASDTAAAGSPLNKILTLPAVAGDFFNYHLPETQAYNLGVTLWPTNILDAYSVKGGPVLTGAANETISQFLTQYGPAAAAASHTS